MGRWNFRTQEIVGRAPRFYYLGVDFACKWLIWTTGHEKVKLDVRTFCLRVSASICTLVTNGYRRPPLMILIIISLSYEYLNGIIVIIIKKKYNFMFKMYDFREKFPLLEYLAIILIGTQCT